MTHQKPVVDYRQFRPSRLNTDSFRHLKLLLYWPLFGLLFWFAERGVEVDEYHIMYCALDEYIPFCEWFLIPYLFWFVFLVGMHLYTLLFDVHAFRRMMYFIILTYSAALVIFFLFPNTRALRNFPGITLSPGSSSTSTSLTPTPTCAPPCMWLVRWRCYLPPGM